MSQSDPIYVIVHPETVAALARLRPELYGPVYDRLKRILREQEYVLIRTRPPDAVPDGLEYGRPVRVCGVYASERFRQRLSERQRPPLPVDAQLAALSAAGFDAELYEPASVRFG